MVSRIELSFEVILIISTLWFASPFEETTDHSFANYMMKSKFSDDPEVSMRCFAYYLPILGNVTARLARSFQECTSSRDNRINLLNKRAESDRFNIKMALVEVRDRVSACDRHPESLAFFDCISAQGDINQKTFYKITQNSTDNGAELREHHRLLEVYKFRCQNSSQRAYIQDTAKTYSLLDACLQSDNVPTTTAATTKQESPSSSLPTINPPFPTASDLWHKTTQNEPLSSLIDQSQMVLSDLQKFLRQKLQI